MFCDRPATQELTVINSIIRSHFPEALIAGSSSYGVILDGMFVKGDIIVTASFFEQPGSKVEVLAYPLAHDGAADMARQLIQDVAERPWVKAIEAMIMNNDESLDEFCDIMSSLPEDIMIFGGESHFTRTLGAPRFVVGPDGKEMEWGAVFVLFGGEDLHFMMRYVQGCKALGSELTATSFDGNVLHELDGQPAFELYNRYLRIENDENFLTNALDFPLLFNVGDNTTIVRTPVSCTQDGGIVLASTVPPSGRLRIGCGDPGEVLDSIGDCGQRIANFRPDAILAFSCAARRLFWSDSASSRETKSFQTIAPTSGFYTAGELIRVNDRLVEHTSTLVVAAAREGAREDKPPVEFVALTDRRKKSLVSRFAFFIDAAMEELRDANHQLEVLSKTDGLTGLANRREIESIIRASCKLESENMPSLIMMDLDDFKQINDTYGHREGDEALKRFAQLAKLFCEESGYGISMGRWGGEEFIMLMRGTDEQNAAAFAEQLRDAFEKQNWDFDVRHTVSMGVTRVRKGEKVDAALSRVDEAMYNAKRAGKNRVAVLD